MKKIIIFLFIGLFLFASLAFAARFHTVTAANGAINSTLYPLEVFKGWQLESVKLHLSSAGGAGSFTITVDANAGSTYDIIVFTQDMTTATDVIWIPERPLVFQSGDKLIFSYANANNRTYGLEVVWNSSN